MDLPFKKEPFLNLSNPDARNAFVTEARDTASLLHKELDTNLSEQAILAQRIRMMKELANDLSSSDPQYSMIRLQIQMDLIELDELKRREDVIAEQLKHL